MGINVVYGQPALLAFPGEQWASSDKLRFIPPTLINPIEPGTTRDETRPGTGLEPQVPKSYKRLTPDPHNDLLIIGQQHVANGARTASLQISGGRHVRLIGFDADATKLTVVNPVLSAFIEGVRGDFSASRESDFIFVGGAPSDLPVKPKLYVQNCHGRGLHGTNMGHDAGTPINTVAVMTGSSVAVELNADMPYLPAVGSRAIIGKSSFDDDASPLANFNYTWAVKQAIDARHVVLANHFGADLPPDGAVGKDGTLWLMRGGGLHADGLQLDSDKFAEGLYIDRCTFESSYQAIMAGSQRAKTVASRVNFRHPLTFDPQDYNSWSLIDSADAQGGEYYEVFAPPRPRIALTNALYPQGQMTTIGDLPALHWPELRNRRGVIFGRDHPDFADYAALGRAYQSPGYGDMPKPTIDLLTGLALDNLAFSNGGGHVGRITVDHGTVGQIIDVHLSQGAGFKVEGSALIATSPHPGAIELTATIRGTGLSIARTFLM